MAHEDVWQQASAARRLFLFEVFFNGIYQTQTEYDGNRKGSWIIEKFVSLLFPDEAKRFVSCVTSGF